MRNEENQPREFTTAEQAAAYAEAERRIAQAKAEGWKFLNIGSDESEQSHGDEERAGTPVLAALTTQPPEIAELTQLERLDIDKTRIADISLLQGLRGLQRLYLANTQVSDVRALAGLSALQELYLEHTQVSDLRGLAGLSGLQELFLSNTRVSDVRELEGLSGLQTLSFNTTQVSDLTALEGLSGLRALFLRNTQVSDLTALEGLSELQELSLNNTQVSDLHALEGLSGLQRLSLRDTQVSDLRGLEGLSGLEMLWLDNTQVSDLRALEDKEQLTTITFSGTPALTADPALEEFSEIYGDRAKVAELQAYLRSRTLPEPSELVETGPAFEAQDTGPILLTQSAMDASADPDQADMHDECRIKAIVLTGHNQKIGNQFPTLASSAERYSQLIHRSAADIGARTIWSAANTLRQALEAHLAAVEQGRPMEELPPEVAAALKDLVETHGVWFLGHPGAAEVESRVRDYTRGPDSAQTREEAIAVVEAAEAAPNVVDPAAVEPAKDDILASEGEGPAAEKAEKSLRDWTWNLIAVAARRLWTGTKWGGGTVASHDLIQWFVGNETILGTFAKHVMTNGPLWFDKLVEALRLVM